MEILNQAITAAGGVSALARHLGVKPNTVSNWQVRGLPAAYTTLFKLMREHHVGVFVTNVNPPDAMIVTTEQISS